MKISQSLHNSFYFITVWVVFYIFCFNFMIVKGTGALKSMTFLFRNAKSCKSCYEVKAQRWLEMSCDSAVWSMAELKSGKAKYV